MKNKILILTLIFILVLSGCFTAFADTVLTETNEVLAQYPDFPTSYTYNGTTYRIYHYLLGVGNGYTCLYCFTDPNFVSYFTSDDKIYLECSEQYPSFRFDKLGESWKQMFFYTSSYSYGGLDGIVYYSFDVYSNKDKVEKVFQGAPLVSLVGLTPNQIATPLKRQIIGLVPLVIGFLVLAIGLRKALTMLLGRLKQA